MNYLKEMKSPERYRREIGIEDGRYMSSERNVTDRSMRVDVSEHARIQIVYTQDAKQVWELLGQNMSECRSFIRRNRSRIWVTSGPRIMHIGAQVARKALGSREIFKWRMGGCRSVVPWQRSGGWEVTNRLYVGTRTWDEG